LEQLGRGRLFIRHPHQDEELVGEVTNEVVKATNYLSKRRIGALIVIERATGVTDYIETGIQLNAKVSSELLINIFIPNTPLHDGAVIIRKDQIMAAGCYLPLSENPFISKELGTRHRAAIGVSELTDVISVIVSEETGQVSLAMEGEIIRDLKEEQLLAKLYEELKPTPKPHIWQRRGKQDG
jgi:diadenylate cyclase